MPEGTGEMRDVLLVSPTCFSGDPAGQHPPTSQPSSILSCPIDWDSSLAAVFCAHEPASGGRERYAGDLRRSGLSRPDTLLLE